jgi:hypothetical protein
MNLYTAIRNALLGLSTVTGGAAGVGSGPSARIWNQWPRTYQTPCIVMEIDDEAENNDLSGKGEIKSVALVLTCRTSVDSSSQTLSQAVRNGLAGYHGTFDAILDDTAHAAVPKSEGSTDHWYDRVMSFTVLMSEAIT